MVDKLLSEVYGCMNQARSLFGSACSVEESVLANSQNNGIRGMGECEQCTAKFSFIRRKHKCNECGLNYCATCARRTAVGLRKCKKCEIFSRWPIDVEQIQALRIKDLRHFLHSSNISTNGCTEKQELVELVVAQLKLRYYKSNHVESSQNEGSENSQRSSIPVTRDDGIRVRATVLVPDVQISINSNDRNIGIHTPSRMDVNLDYDRVSVPVSPSSANQNLEASNTISSSVGNENILPGAIYDLNSISSGASSDSPSPVLNTSSSSPNTNEPLQTSSSSWSLLQADISCEISGEVDPSSFWEEGDPSEEVNQTPGVAEVQEVNEAQVTESVNTPAAAVTDNLGPTSEKPSIPVSLSNIVKLRTIKNEEEIKHLSVRQCKEILALHRADFSAVREKHELVEKVVMLWRDYQETHKGIADLPEDLLCKICMDAPMDCVLLECGHIVSCVVCGKQLAECPVCRQNVIRVVRTFKA